MLKSHLTLGKLVFQYTVKGLVFAGIKFRGELLGRQNSPQYYLGLNPPKRPKISSKTTDYDIALIERVKRLLFNILRAPPIIYRYTLILSFWSIFILNNK